MKGKTRKNRFHLGQAYRAGFSEIENKEAREDKYQTKIWKKIILISHNIHDSSRNIHGKLAIS
jgi:hypothetical protein